MAARALLHRPEEEEQGCVREMIEGMLVYPLIMKLFTFLQAFQTLNLARIRHLELLIMEIT